MRQTRKIYAPQPISHIKYSEKHSDAPLDAGVRPVSDDEQHPGIEFIQKLAKIVQTADELRKRDSDRKDE